jgi:hypothetical protein
MSRRRSWPKPSIPVFGFTVEQLDSLPDYMQVERGSGVQVDSVTIRFGENVLFLSDLAVLALIRQNLGKRPIYFSWSAGSYPDQALGLTPYLVTEGMVRRLNDRALEVVPDSIVDNPVLGPVDLPRTDQLLWNTYHWQAIARPRPQGWVDPPSASILQLYAVVYHGMAETYAARGDSAKAQRADSIAQAIRVSLQPTR